MNHYYYYAHNEHFSLWWRDEISLFYREREARERTSKLRKAYRNKKRSW